LKETHYEEKAKRSQKNRAIAVCFSPKKLAIYPVTNSYIVLMHFAIASYLSLNNFE